MTAEAIASALGGRRAGSGWMARCHAGCDQYEPIANQRSSGLWTRSGPRLIRYAASRSVTNRMESDRDDAKRTKAALSILQAAEPSGATPPCSARAKKSLKKKPPQCAACGGSGADPSSDEQCCWCFGSGWKPAEN